MGWEGRHRSAYERDQCRDAGSSGEKHVPSQGVRWREGEFVGITSVTSIINNKTSTE